MSIIKMFKLMIHDVQDFIIFKPLILHNYKAAAPSLALIRSGIRGRKRRTDHWRDVDTLRKMRRYMS